MGTKNQPSEFDCYNRALPDEPMFVLLARDLTAPGRVRQWAYERERAIARGECPASDSAMIIEARQCADAMEVWRRENDGAWRANADQG